ncbi:hypothetical protein ES703_124509 [subsurface metagenome]
MEYTMLRLITSSMFINLNLTMEKAKAIGMKIKNELDNSSDSRGFIPMAKGSWYKRINGTSPTKMP